MLKPDLCVIGAGSGGLSVAAGAAQMGAKVVLVEGGEMGGDCLNSGCVPSKALIAAAKHAHAMRTGAAFGVHGAEPRIDAGAVRAHVEETIAAIAPHDSQERFEGLGVTVLRDWARFVSDREVVACAARIRARRFVIATGSRAFAPPIPGLDAVPYLTNETIFAFDAIPRKLAIIGAGPIGSEMAQAWRRLGAEIALIDAETALSREDPEAAAVVRETLQREGVVLHEGASVASVSGEAGALRVDLGEAGVIEASHLLVATGRAPTLSRLDLEAGGVEADKSGVRVDDGLRSVSNRRVYAVGDAAGRGQFTHLAGYHAGLVVRSALFRLPVTLRADHIPRVTYTDPELAQVGLTEAEARAEHGDAVEVVRAEFSGNDRARAERRTDGFCKLVLGRKGRILGATIVGPQAGELLQPLALAISAKMKVGALAGMVAPYPTLGEIGKRAAGAYYTPRLFESPLIKRVVRLLAQLG